MKWVAECSGCKFKDSSTNRNVLKQRALAHKQNSGHRVYITGQLMPEEVERCKNSGRTYLAVAGQLL